jgi:C4-dicarboxylate transporter
MTNTADILNLLAAAGGLGVLLVMALVPLLVDHHRPRERRAVAVPARTPREPAEHGRMVAGRSSEASLCP